MMVSGTIQRKAPIAAIPVLIFLLQLASAQSRPSQANLTGRISGVVLRSGSGQPVAGAKVTMDGSNGVSARSVRTDSAGRFSFLGIPGNSSLSVERSGYVTQVDVCEEAHRECEFKPGDTVDDIVVNLVPTGTISGVVSERGGRPIALVQVELLQVTYEQHGVKTFSPTLVTQTDDHGEYRFHQIVPGRYFIRAGTPMPPADSRPLYSRLYYPNETDSALAAAIDVQPGAEMNDRNLWLFRSPVFRIRGHVTDSRTGQAPAVVRLTVVPLAPGEQPFAASFDRRSSEYKGDTFELRNFFPGDYLLVFTLEQFRSVGGEELTPIRPVVGYARVRVADADVEDVEVGMMSGGSLSGRVVVEGQERAGGLPIRPPSIQLRPLLDGSHLEIGGVPFVTLNFNESSPTDSARYKPDGTFRFDDLRPGHYRVDVTGLPQGYYIKDARLDGDDVLEHDMDFAGSASGALTIVLGMSSASVSGEVTNEKLDPSEAVIVLVPDRLRHRPDLYRFAHADASGHFKVTGIPPGDYRAFAWKTVETHAYYNAEFLAEFAAAGMPVHVTEGSNPTLNLKVLVPTKP